MSKKASPTGHTHKNVDHTASKLMHSKDADVRSVAAAALSDTRPSAHTRNHVASLAASLMNTGNKQERSVAASVLRDHQTKK